MNITLLLSLFLFLLGLYWTNCNKVEHFDNKIPYRCPDVLIQKGNKYTLFNSKVAKVPGVNPIEFGNLEEYVEFLDWQRSQGINCPVLFLQQSFDAQGNPVLKAKPCPQNLAPGLNNQQVGDNSYTKLFDASRNDPPYNENSYPGYDPDNQYIGLDNPLDKMFYDESEKSPNPADPNWAGKEYTLDLINKGYYKNNEVYKTY